MHVPSNENELDVRRVLPDKFPDVHGENGGGGVEDRGQGGHQGSQHHGQHQTTSACTIGTNWYKHIGTRKFDCMVRSLGTVVVYFFKEKYSNLWEEV